jgi:hypothetical protein
VPTPKGLVREGVVHWANPGPWTPGCTSAVCRLITRWGSPFLAYLGSLGSLCQLQAGQKLCGERHRLLWRQRPGRGGDLRCGHVRGCVRGSGCVHDRRLRSNWRPCRTILPIGRSAINETRRAQVRACVCVRCLCLSSAPRCMGSLRLDGTLQFPRCWLQRSLLVKDK